MKRNKIILVFLIVLTAASLFALSACNESGTDGGKTPTLKYPMSQLPTDLLEPQDYLKVSDSYADGYRKFEFTFDEMTAAGKEKPYIRKTIRKSNSDKAARRTAVRFLSAFLTNTPSQICPRRCGMRLCLTARRSMRPR